MPRASLSSVSRSALRSLLLLIALVAVAFVARDVMPPASRAAAVARSAPMPMSQMAPMTDDEMKAASAAWWATHPRRPASFNGTLPDQTPAVIYTVQNYNFDSDGNAATAVDTARIMMGQSVQWNWVNGYHTVTSGVDGNDVNAGMLFDQPLDPYDLSFAYTFNNPGTYPFFCRNHWTVGMKGVVVVAGATPTRKTSWGSVKSLYRP